jgi:exonuclease III
MRRGTVIIVHDTIHIWGTDRLPTDRGIAAWCGNLYCVNIYVPSGHNRREQEKFFNINLPYLLRFMPQHFITGGDFNCVLQNIDVTGLLNYSQTLGELVCNWRFVDSWTNTPTQRAFTHYAIQSASRIDTIYTLQTTAPNKTGSAIIRAPVTDYLAVMLQIDLDNPHAPRGRGTWKLNTDLLNWEELRMRFAQDWA